MVKRSASRPTAGGAKSGKVVTGPRPAAHTRRSKGRMVTLRTNGQITLPAELRDRVGARTGDVFLAEVEDDALVLRPKRLVDASQAWFWTPEWQKAEREADADIKAGRVKRFRDVEELIADLDA
ncbi:MAG: AbrB/MazE/SpoVT family DNA-binding domain-containing protein [Candidatus Limnocylindria bacterium]